MCEVFIYCHRRGYLAVARLYLEGQCEKPQIVGRVTRLDSHAFVYLAVTIIYFFDISAKPESRKAMKKQENNHETEKKGHAAAIACMWLDDFVSIGAGKFGIKVCAECDFGGKV